MVVDCYCVQDLKLLVFEALGNAFDMALAELPSAIL